MRDTRNAGLPCGERVSSKPLPKAVKHRISANERARIIELLKTRPIAEVRQLTQRSYITLSRIAQVALHD